MPPFTSWYLGNENIGRPDRDPVPRRHQRHADDRDPRQRPARVRPLHAHQGRRLRAVPPPGPRHPRRQGGPRRRVLRRRRCSPRSGCRPGCRPTTGPATRSRPTSRSRAETTSLSATNRSRTRDDAPRSTAPSSCWSGRWPTPAVMLADVRPDAPGPAHPVRRLDARPAARPHGGRARRLHRGRGRPGRGRPGAADPRPGSRRCARRPAPCSAPGRRPGRRRERRSRSATWASTPRCWSPPRPSRSPCTAGTSARPPAGGPASPADLAGGLLAVAQHVIDPADRGARFAGPRPASADAPSDERLLAWTGRT